MKNKILIIICLIFFISLSCVSASDINQTDIDNVDNTILSASNDVNVDNVLSANENIDENYTLTLSNDNDVLSDEGEYVDASEGYERLNAFRTENGVWQLNKDDTTRTVFNTNDSNQLKPLVRDIALEETAKIRAKEVALMLSDDDPDNDILAKSHKRPDGSDCWSAFPGGYNTVGENIAMGQETWYDVVDAWKETEKLYGGQGHRRNMLDPSYNSVGVAGYKLNGRIYWAQDFGGKYNAEELTKINPEDAFTVKNNTQKPEFNIQLPNNATGTFSVRVDGNVIDSEVLSNGEATITASDLSEGSHEVILSYGGDSNYYTVNQVTSVNVLDDSTPVVPSTSSIYVNGSKNKNGDGSIGNPFNNLKSALDKVESGGIIYIAPGLYIGKNNTCLDLNRINLVNWTAGEVKFSKNIQPGFIFYGHDFNITGLTFSTITEGGIEQGDKIIHITGGNLTIKDCTFINNVVAEYAAIIYNSGGNLTINDCTFINNQVVYNCHVIYNNEGNVNVIDCSFINNTENDYVNSIIMGADFVSNCTFINNSVHAISGADFVSNCTFINNSAQRYHGTISGTDFVSNCTFINNRGGAISNGDAYNCTFINNTSGYGGAISDGDAYNCSFINNIADVCGGAIWKGSAYNCSFINNIADVCGGAKYDVDDGGNAYNCTFINNTARNGGAIYSVKWDNSTFINYNCTFINNSASSGSAIMIQVPKFAYCFFIMNSNIVDCHFDNNYIKYYENATNYGGTIYLNESIYADDYETEIGLINCSIDNCIFKNNNAKYAININSFANVSLNNNELNNELIYNNNGTITSPTSIIVLDNKTISSYSNEVMLTANIFDDNGNSIVCDDFNFTINNKSIKGTLEYDTFKANVTLDDGKYIVGAEVNNLTDNTVKIGIIDVNTTQEVIIITAPDVTKYYGDSKQLTVTVTKNGSPFADAEIKINLDGNTYTKTTNNKGEAYLPIDLDSGIYDATITYTNSSSLVPAKVVKITVKPVNTEINLSYAKDSRNSVTLTAIVNSTNATGDIVFNVNGKEYTSKISNSKATYTLNNLEIGTYAVNASYAGDINHKSSNSDNLTFTIEDVIIITAPDVTKYYGGSERFIVTLKDKDNKAIAGENVAITINGQKYIRTTNSDGEASMAINLNSGEYVAVSQCNGHNATSKVTVLSTISAKDVTKIFRNGTQYYATFLDTKGNLLKNTPVTFNINGVFYTRNTDEKGVARLNINLNPGTYLITAKNPNSAEDYSNNITVLSSIVENHDIVKYYKNDTQYWVRILNDDGSVAGAGVSVTFNINGVFYTRTTNESGYVRLNINLNPNTYIITVMYNGLSVSNTIKVLPVLSANNLNMHYRDGSKFEAKLVDGQGNVLANQLITFNINGVFYDRMTNDNGIAMLNINLMAGKYIITSMYSNGASISNNVTIKLRLD